jgi:hypothetical protein
LPPSDEEADQSDKDFGLEFYVTRRVMVSAEVQTLAALFFWPF